MKRFLTVFILSILMLSQSLPAFAVTLNNSTLTGNLISGNVTTTSSQVTASIYKAAGGIATSPVITNKTGTFDTNPIDISTLPNGDYKFKVTDNVNSAEVAFTKTPANTGGGTGGTGGGPMSWYYTNDGMIAGGNFYKYDTEALCKAGWQLEIDTKYKTDAANAINQKITTCGGFTADPTPADFTSALHPYTDFASSVNYFYYITYVLATDKWGISNGYTTLSDCMGDLGKDPNVAANSGGCKSLDRPPFENGTGGGNGGSGGGNGGSGGSGGNNNTPINISPAYQGKGNTVYNLLAPIGKLSCIDTSGADKNCAKGGIGDYLNIIFQYAIGLCGALAVIMIVINSIQYMGDESVFGKTEAKSKIFSSIIGLLIALGSYALLNTISPDLLGKNGLSIESVNVELVNLPDAGDSTVDPDFAKKNYKYSTDASVSPGVVAAVVKLKQGWQIDYFKVYSNKRMMIALKNGSQTDNTNMIDVDIGVNGFAPNNQAKAGDNKTPIGDWKILDIRTSKNNAPVYSIKGSNMGASFWLLSPMTTGERGIGMHGNKNGTLTPTNGCLRLKNSDLLALLPYIKTGITVTISG